MIDFIREFRRFATFSDWFLIAVGLYILFQGWAEVCIGLFLLSVAFELVTFRRLTHYQRENIRITAVRDALREMGGDS